MLRERCTVEDLGPLDDDTLRWFLRDRYMVVDDAFSKLQRVQQMRADFRRACCKGL